MRRPRAAALTAAEQMKSVGEVMAIGRTWQESFQKAMRGMEAGLDGWSLPKVRLHACCVRGRHGWLLPTGSDLPVAQGGKLRLTLCCCD